MTIRWFLMRAAGILIMLSFSSPAFSFYFNNYQHIIGDRAAGMGSAFCALADNSIALWYNPAGLANLNKMNVSISANTYSYLEANTNGFWELPDGAGAEKIDVKEKESTIVANSVSFGISIGKKKGFSLGIFVPFQNDISGSLDAEYTNAPYGVSYKASYTLESKYYVFMAGYGMEVVDNLNVGVSLGMGFYESKFEFDKRVLFDAGAVYGLITEEKNSDNKFLTQQIGLGAQYTIKKNHIIGLHFKSPVWNLYADAEVEYLNWISSNTGVAYAGSTPFQTIDTDFDVYEQLRPMSIDAGYAFNMKNSFSITLETEIFFTTGYQKNIVVNYKLGMEYFLFKFLVLRSGFYTDFSQADDVTTGSKKGNQPFVDKIDYYGGTFSVSYGTNIGDVKKDRMSWTTLGVNFRYGTGNIQTFKIVDYQTVDTIIRDKNVWSLSLFLAETISF